MWGKYQIVELNIKAVKRDRDYDQCRINPGTMIGNDRDGVDLYAAKICNRLKLKPSEN